MLFKKVTKILLYSILFFLLLFVLFFMLLNPPKKNNQHHQNSLLRTSANAHGLFYSLEDKKNEIRMMSKILGNPEYTGKLVYGDYMQFPSVHDVEKTELKSTLHGKPIKINVDSYFDYQQTNQNNYGLIYYVYIKTNLNEEKKRIIMIPYIKKEICSEFSKIFSGDSPTHRTNLNLHEILTKKSDNTLVLENNKKSCIETKDEIKVAYMFLDE